MHKTAGHGSKDGIVKDGMTQPTARIAPDILRILAPNPSAMTGPGTNTWILGIDRLLIVDPGPEPDAGDETHLAQILQAVRGHEVAGILLTHGHRDHTGLAPALARATGAPIMAISPSQPSGRAEALGLRFDHPPRILPAPDIALADGNEIEGWRVLHTPGHMHDHLCLWRDDGWLVTGDTVMGWATSVIPPPSGDMADYMDTLTRLAALQPRTGLPGHGEVIADTAARIATLATHRRTREARLVSALQQGPATCTELTARAYSGLPARLVVAAQLSCLAHLVALAAADRVTTDGGPWREAVFALA